MANDPTALAVCDLEINGAKASPDILMALLECVVDESIYLPSACTLRLFIDPSQQAGLSIIDSEDLPEGAEIKVKLGYHNTPGGDNMAVVFAGEIVGVDLDLSALGVSSYTVRALDKSHRMHIGVNQKVFLNVTDSDVIQTVVSANGLSANIDATSDVRDWIAQSNQSDWDFVKHLAWRNGMRLYMDRTETVVATKFDHTASTVELKWQDDILSFRPRTAANSQVASVSLRSWDMKNKQVLVGQSKGDPAVPSPAADIAGKKAGTMFKSQPTTICGFPLFDQGSADAMADAMYQTVAAEYLKADVLCQGNYQLMPGVKVKLDGVGDKFSGTYTVTTATHVYGPKAGYTTQIGVDGGFGAGADTLLGADASTASSGAGTSNGSVNAGLNSANLQVCVGIVTNNSDADNLGRVKIKFPFLADDSESFWARIATPMGGSSRGFLYLPEVNDEVLVAFEHGDIHRPYIIGGLWNGQDNPPETNDKAVVNNQVVHRLIKTRIGHSLLFDDTDGKGEIISTTCGAHTFTLNDKDQMIQAKTTSGHILVMDDKNKKVQVTTTGGHTLTMDDQGKQIHVKTTGSLELIMDDNTPSITLQDAAGNSLKIDGSSNKITLNSMGDVSIQAMENINLQAQMNVQIQGLQVQATAQTQLSLQGQAMASLQSSGETQIQGSMVMIN